MQLLTKVFTSAAMLMALLTSPVAGAQAWPTQPVKLMLPFPAGGTSDAVVRVLSERAQKELGQAIVVENKPGAAGRLMQRALKAAPPNGYTIGYTSTTAPVVAAGDDKLDYDLIKDYTPITILGEFYGAIAVSADLPVNSVAEFVRYVKEHPGKLSYGSFGQGSQNHFYVEQMKYELGIDMLHVPFRGEADSMNALMGKTIQMVVLARVPADYATSTRFKILAVTAPKRWSIAPDLPTMAELGYPSLLSRTWFGLSGPAGMSADAVNRLQAAYIRAAKDPQVEKRLTEMGYVLNPGNGARLTSAIEEDLGKYRAIKSRAKIELQ